VSFPVRTLTLSRLSASFVGRPRFRRTARAVRPCWCTVATVYPLGNCDSLKSETNLRYLIRFGTASNHSSPPGSFSRYWQRANAIRGTGEFCLRSRTSRSGLRGAEPTSLTQPFPGHPGLSLRLIGLDFITLPSISVLSMNCHHSNRLLPTVNELLSAHLFTKHAARDRGQKAELPVNIDESFWAVPLIHSRNHWWTDGVNKLAVGGHAGVHASACSGARHSGPSLYPKGVSARSTHVMQPLWGWWTFLAF